MTPIEREHRKMALVKNYLEKVASERQDPDIEEKKRAMKKALDSMNKRELCRIVPMHNSTK